MGAVFINTGNHSVTGGGNHAGFVHFEQLLQEFLVFPVGFGKNFPLGGIIRVLEGEQRRPGIQGLLRLGIDGGHRAREGCSLPWAVDFQLSRANTGNGNGLAYRIALVRNRHHQLAAEVRFHPSGNFFSVRQSDGHSVSGGKVRACGEPDAQLAVQTQHRQSPMLQHDALHPVAFPGVDQFHPSAGGCGNLRGCFFVGIGFHLFFHSGHGVPNFGDGGHDTDLVHSGKGVALADHIPVFHQKFGDFHIFRNRNILRLSGFQCASAVDGTLDGADGGVGAEDTGLRAVLGLLLPGHQRHERQPQHSKRQHTPEDVPLYRFLLRLVHLLILRSAGRRWASFLPPYWQDTARIPRRSGSRRPLPALPPPYSGRRSVRR